MTKTKRIKIVNLFIYLQIYKRQQQEAGNNTMPSLGNSLPKEWEEKTNQLHVRWEEVQSKQSKSQLEESSYEESLFMFEDGIVPFPSQFAKDDSNDSRFLFSFEDLLLEEQKKELMQRVHVFTNHVMHAPRDSKRLPVFKDVAPN